MEYVIGLDIGTSNIKAVAFSHTGNILSSVSQPGVVYHPHPNFSEQSAEEILSAVLNCLSRLCNQMQGKPTAIGLCSAMHSLVGIDRRGRPLTPCIIWADNRAQEEAAELHQYGNALYQQSGTPMHPMLPLAKLRWLAKHEPYIMADAYAFVDIKAFIWFRLFGELVCDSSLASASGLYNASTSNWNPSALELSFVEDTQLPKIVSPLHTNRHISAQIANQIGLPPDVAFVIGASDGCAASLGSGAIHSERLALSMGTSGAVRMGHSGFKPDPHARTFCYHLVEELFVSGGAVNNGGIALDWLKNLWQQEGNINDIFALAASSPDGANGLLCLPYLLGERAPIWNAKARGVFFGLDIRHSRADMTRTLLEGSLMALDQVTQVLCSLYPDTANASLIASGGMAQSAFWLQLLSNISGRAVHVPEHHETASWGAALLALRATDYVSSAEMANSGVTLLQTYTPQAEIHGYYNELAQKFARLYVLLKDEF